MAANEYGTSRAAFDRWCATQAPPFPDLAFAWEAWKAGVNFGAETIADLESAAAADLLELERIGATGPRRPVRTPRTSR